MAPTTYDHAPMPARRTLGAAALLVSLLLILAGCGSEEKLGGTVVEDGLGCTITEVDRRTDDVPVVEAGIEVGDEASTEDLIEGDEKACLVDSAKYLTLDLVGAEAADGREFTSTFADDRPINARLGQNQLLPGLESALDGMVVGMRRQVVLPAALAYGADGNPAQDIGPDTDLVFVVDLVSLTDGPVVCNPPQPLPDGVREGKPTEIALPAEPVTGEDVVTTVLTEGTGPAIKTTSYVTLDYVGMSCAYAKQFDSSWDREEPITIAMTEAEPAAGASTVIPGWTDGLEGQREGSLVQLDIPPAKAYGAQGSPPDIGPNDPLTFVIKIEKVSDEAPPAPETDSSGTVVE